ncbi:MAG: substrate-binding domain-containing protein [Lachnospiraceae bacterium]|nr:substrate-binding domain-containing protein [Lachnospiraceae bacterium]
MKKTGKDIRILTGVMAVLTCVVLVLMLQIFPIATSTQEAEAQYRYIYLAPVGEEDFFVEIAGGVSAADEDGGTDTLLVRYEDEDTLSACVGDALLSDVDGIIVKAIPSAAELVEEAAAYGVPVIYYDTDFADSGRVAYVGIDNYQAGMTAMCALAEALGGEGNVLLAVRSDSAESQAERIQGCQAALNDYPDMRIAGILSNSGNELLYKEMLMEALEEDPSISAILCLDGISADATGKLL